MKDTKLRSVNTHFWDDDYIQKLDPSQKLLFLYLLTNPLTNLIGVYEISVRRIGFDTGFDKETLLNMLERFSKDGKIFYQDSFIILANFLKNQKFNANMQKGADQRIELLPLEIKRFILSKGLKGFETIRKDSKPFETIQNHSKGFETLRKEEDEVEDEVEDEIEGEGEGNFANHFLPKPDHLDLSRHIDERDLNDEQKLERINSIHNELKNSESWLIDVRRISKLNHTENWHMVKQFLDELKAKEDYYKTLAEIKKHCVSWIRKYKPATAS